MKPGFVHSIDSVVQYFLKKGVTPLKLQKLLYYAQLWYFVKYRKYLFQDDMKAWVFGPVVPAVWQKFKFVKRNDPIPTNNHFYNLDQLAIDDNTRRFLDNVWWAYGHLSGSDLVDLTHSELPWQIARQNLQYTDRSNNNLVIDTNTTRNHQLDDKGDIPFVSKLKTLGYFSF